MIATLSLSRMISPHHDVGDHPDADWTRAIHLDARMIATSANRCPDLPSPPTKPYLFG
jgi:hypothetical protein